MKKITKSIIEKEVMKLDPKLKRTDESFFVATVLLAGLQVGADTKKIASFLEVEPKKIEEYARNLKKAKIWSKGVTNCNWFDEESGGIAFWMDVLVAQGMLLRK